MREKKDNSDVIAGVAILFIVGGVLLYAVAEAFLKGAALYKYVFGGD